MDQSNFDNLMLQLLSNDNAARGAAEITFIQMVDQVPEQVVLLLSSILQPRQVPTDPNTLQNLPKEMKQLALTQLRRMLIKRADSKLPCLSPACLESLKSGLLSAIKIEKSRDVLRLLADMIGDLAHKIPGGWDGLLNFLFNCTQSQDSSEKFASFLIFADLAILLGPEPFRPYFSAVGQIIHSGLTDNDIHARVAALNASAAFLQVLTEPNETLQFQHFVPLMIDCIRLALAEKEVVEARKALEVFVEISSQAPLFFNNDIVTVINAMFFISSASSGYDNEMRQTAIEVLLSLSEERPSFMKKQQNFMQTLVPLLISWLLEVEDDPGWHTFDEDFSVTNAQVAEQGLDRLSLCMGGKTVVPLLFSHLPSLLGNKENWKHRWAAILSVSTCAEGCRFVIKKHIPDLMNLIMPFMQDPHPRVRWAAVNCIGQFCLDFGPDFQNRWGEVIMPPILNMADDPSLRVKAHFASTLADFCESAHRKTIEKYLDLIIPQLYKLMQSTDLHVLEAFLSTLAAIADCVLTAFKKYYDTFVPFLKSIMQTAKAKEYRSLRGRAIECLSLIGVAVGKERFLADANDVMTEMLHTQVLDASDPQISFFEAAFARIAECLRMEFVPYLQLVVPPALKRATIDVKIEVFKDSKPIKGWEMFRIGEQSIGIHTSELDERAEALHILLVYASHLGEGFMPYVEQVAQVCVKGMRFYYHEGVRVEAASGVPHLLRCVLRHMQVVQMTDPTLLLHLWNYLYAELIQALIHETDREIITAQMEALLDSLDALNRPVFNCDQLKVLVDVGRAYLTDWEDRADARTQARALKECSDEDNSRISDEQVIEEKLLKRLCDWLGRIARFHPDLYFPLFTSKIVPMALQMLAADRTSVEKQRALLLIDDCIEYACPHAIQLLPTVMGFLLHNATASQPGLRQAAIFGLGIAGQNCGEAFAPYVNEALRILNTIIQQPDSRNEYNAEPTETAISAIARIMRGQQSRINFAELIPPWLSYLPVVEDVIESQVTYDTLCSFIEANNPIVIGENFKNIPGIVKIFARIVNTNLINIEIQKRISRILGHMQTAVPPQIVQAAWGILDEQERINLVQLNQPATPSQ